MIIREYLVLGNAVDGYCVDDSTLVDEFPFEGDVKNEKDLTDFLNQHYFKQEAKDLEFEYYDDIIIFGRGQVIGELRP